MYGTLLALGLYTIWLLVTMGNIPASGVYRHRQKGGNIDVLVQALSGVLNSRSLDLAAGRVLKLCGSEFVPWRNAGSV